MLNTNTLNSKEETMETNFPKVEEQKVVVGNYIGLRNATQRYKGLVNPETGHLYGIVGKDYHTIPHQNAVEMVMDAIKTMPEYGVPVVNTKFIKEGSRMITNIRFPEVDLEVKAGDVINPNVQVYNSYDGGWKYELGFGAFRLVCTNGLMVGERVLQIKRKHTGNFNEMYIKQELLKGMEAFSEQKKIWETWVDKQITLTAAQKKIEEMDLNKKELEQVNKTIEVSSGMKMKHGRPYVNYWLFANLLYQIITHNVKSENRRRELLFRASRVLNS